MKRIMVLAAMAALLSLYGCGQDTLTSPSTTLADEMGEVKENPKGKDQDEVCNLCDDYYEEPDGGPRHGREYVSQADEMGEIKENKKGPGRPPVDPGPYGDDRGRATERVQDGN